MNDDTGELVRQWKEKARSDWTAVRTGCLEDRMG